MPSSRGPPTTSSSPVRIPTPARAASTPSPPCSRPDTSIGKRVGPAPAGPTRSRVVQNSPCGTPLHPPPVSACRLEAVGESAKQRRSVARPGASVHARERLRPERSEPLEHRAGVGSVGKVVHPVGVQWELQRALSRTDQRLRVYDGSVSAHLDRLFP